MIESRLFAETIDLEFDALRSDRSDDFIDPDARSLVRLSAPRCLAFLYYYSLTQRSCLLISFRIQ